MLRNDADSWGAPAKLFHWVMAALILAQIALGLMAVNWRLSPTKLNLFVLHKSTRPLILALLALRLARRPAQPTPPLPLRTGGRGRTPPPLKPLLLSAPLNAPSPTRPVV